MCLFVFKDFYCLRISYVYVIKYDLIHLLLSHWTFCYISTSQFHVFFFSFLLITPYVYLVHTCMGVGHPLDHGQLINSHIPE